VEIRKAIMGHSSGEDVNSIYTHVELPIKREAIQKLEAWVEAQRTKLREEGGQHDSAKTRGDGSAEIPVERSGRAEAVAEEKPD